MISMPVVVVLAAGQLPAALLGLVAVLGSLILVVMMAISNFLKDNSGFEVFFLSNMIDSFL